ncbi:MAG: HAMP domain-containing protein [Actinobacteria bacterium]|uniref:histidine kinase n=1 Tax=freshwater metagenome TaxID=449393 RepID=A0A6J6PWH1_9ZZZZ|nr:HAMP domain-containing protein [Actinomycetota bacterium]
MTSPQDVPAQTPETERRSVVRLQRAIQIGLRGRIVLAVAAVAMLLSVVLAVTTVTVAKNTLLTTREQTLTAQAIANADTVSGALGSAETADLQTLLSSLPESGSPLLLTGAAVPLSGEDPSTVSVDARYGIDALPAEFLDSVVQERNNAVMRFRFDGESLLVVGVALPDSNASYFQINQLGDIDTAIRSLGLRLAFAALLTTFVAVGLGYWASKYALRPLNRIRDAAESVALGQLDTRIEYADYAADPDLAPLVANFNDMVSALQERINRDARFASDVSHELRSPLTTLNASIEVLQNTREVLPERSQQALDLLSLDMGRFTQLVEDLLEISRFDAGAVRLELDAVALVPTVEAAVRMVAHAAVPVEADPELTDLVIACDKRRLVRILANFFDNARKYADGATSVTVELHEPDHLGIILSAPTVRISVEDSGPGVPEGERDKIFDRFNRGDQGGSRGIDMGVGLGLALAAEHARLQGGSVWVEDRHDGGQGSRFVLELPMMEPLEADDPEDLAAVTPAEAETFALTGQMPAIRLDESPDPPV